MNNHLNKEELKEKIENDEDFIYCPRLGNSIKNLLKVHPEGIDNERIAKVMLMTEEEVEEVFQNAVKKIQSFLKMRKEEK
ncbi:MAG: hypothetical protein PHF86_10430 [Candidatus Nanoarchaeia archaeon]|jgi:hypothetical protein|nr:hypothetical protein [Candidatus Nanoarchaeia archaeon]